MINSAKGKITAVLLSVSVLCLTFGLIAYGKAVSAAVIKGVGICLNTLIPSLFAFTVMSSLLVSSGLYRVIGLPFSPLARYVFRMTPEEFSVFLISQAAGYPVGASLISEMRRSGRISDKRCGELMRFCIAPGPSFVLGITSVLSPNNPQIYAALFIAVIASNTAAALITAIGKTVPEKTTARPKIRLSADVFTESVSRGAAAMTVICSMVIFFCAVIAVIDSAGITALVTRVTSKVTKTDPNVIYPIIRGMLEISNTVYLTGSSLFTLPMAAALLTFGGICVHLQIKAVCGNIPIFGSLLFHVPCGIMAYIVCKAIMPHFYIIQVAVVFAEIRPKYSEFSPILSLILLIMTILILSQKNVAKNKKI